MAFVITPKDKGWVELSFENKVSLWSILKTVSKTPYLKSFIVDKYDGGNTMIDKEYWNQEEIMYSELSNGKYLFPYDSIGFILDDSISDIELSVIDTLDKTDPARSHVEYQIIIKDTDQLSILLPNRDHVYDLASLYLFSMFDSGYDHVMMFTLSQGLKGLIKDKVSTIDIVEGSFKVRLDSMHFVLKLNETAEKDSYYYIKLGKHFSKKAIQEKNINNLSYLKKKLLNKISLFQKIAAFLAEHSVLGLLVNIGIYSVLIGLVLWLVPKFTSIRTKKLIPLIALIFIALGVFKLIMKYVRKNIYKRYLKNSN